MNDNDLQDSVFEHIEDGRMRAFLTALALTGHVGRSATAAGLSDGLIYTARWRHDLDFQDAKREAMKIAADGLEDVARERAVEGVKSYKFTKDGSSLRHPDRCDCGHERGGHVVTPHEGKAGTYRGPCSGPDCDCARFDGRPYYEHAYSDTLLKFLLQGAKPETYSNKVELSLLSKLDMSKLPDAVLQRLADGENALQVLASAAEAGMIAAQDLRQLPPPKEEAAVPQRDDDL